MRPAPRLREPQNNQVQRTGAAQATRKTPRVGKDDPHRFAMIERWVSVEAYQAHFEQNVEASGVLDRAVALMIEPPKGEYYLLR